jgi:ribonuclease Z
LPTTRHFATSQVVNVREKLYMIDCGEGAQMQLRRQHLKFTRLNHIFISHLHGDHCFGLPGLISTFGMLGRTADLHLYAHPDLERLLFPQLEYFCKGMKYEVKFHPIHPQQAEVIYEDRSLTVSTLPLQHRLPTCGFLFTEKPTRLSTPDNPPRRYAYCSDTRPIPELAQTLHGVDLLFHEATFMEKDAPRAAETYHTTARQAALLARQAEAKQLLIGHFSARYDDEQGLLEEAQAIFPHTLLAHENLQVSI